MIALLDRRSGRSMRAKLAFILLSGVIAPLLFAAEPPQGEGRRAESAARPSRAVMTVEEVVQLLDETVDWYRTLGTQQQAATQPSDLLILYANRQTAAKVMALAFEIARANAELISSEETAARADDPSGSGRSLQQAREQLDEQRRSLQGELEAATRKLEAAPAPSRAELQARVSVLERGIELVNARRNFLDHMVRFQHESDEAGFGANALKAHIDAIAASIPAASGGTAPAPVASLAAAQNQGSTASSSTELGIWDLTGTVFRLATKIRTIDSIDRRTQELQELFASIRTPPLERLQALATRGDALAAQSDAADTATLRGVRDQFDTLAWLF